jgi:hypothetical protein
MESFFRQTLELLETIENCLAQRRLLPALILLYSAIDIIAGLERPEGQSTKSSFVSWVETHMLRDNALDCTALELYAARCGLLHSYSADSALSQSKQARKVLYAWGTADVDHLKQAAHILGQDDCVALHVSDFVKAFRKGLADYVESVWAHPERKSIVSTRIDRWYVNMQPELLAEFLRVENNSDFD